MVQIPTVKRQFYNTTSKLNTTGSYAKATSSTISTMQKTYEKQQADKIKEAVSGVEMSLYELQSQRRRQFAADPYNEEGRQSYLSGVETILKEKRAHIDRLYQKDYDSVIRKLRQKADLSDREWMDKQDLSNQKERQKQARELAKEQQAAQRELLREEKERQREAQRMIREEQANAKLQKAEAKTQALYLSNNMKLELELEKEKFQEQLKNNPDDETLLKEHDKALNGIYNKYASQFDEETREVFDKAAYPFLTRTKIAAIRENQDEREDVLQARLKQQSAQRKMAVSKAQQSTKTALAETVVAWEKDNQKSPLDEKSYNSLKEALLKKWDEAAQNMDGDTQALYNEDKDVVIEEMLSGVRAWGEKQQNANAFEDAKSYIQTAKQEAYAYGQQSNYAAARQTYNTSFNQMHDYLIQTVGAQQAEKVFRDFKSNYTKSFIQGQLENDPEAALSSLKSGLYDKELSDPEAKTTFIKKAENLIKAQKTAETTHRRMNAANARFEFWREPTLENYRQWEALDPESAKKNKKKAFEFMENVPNVEAQTNYESYSEAMEEFQTISNMFDETPEDMIKKTQAFGDFISKVLQANKEGNISHEDTRELIDTSAQTLSDDVFMKKIQTLPKMGIFQRLQELDIFLPYRLAQKGIDYLSIKKIGMRTIKDVISAVRTGADSEQITKIYNDGIKAAIKQKYKDVPELQTNEELIPGKSHLTIQGKPYLFKGFSGLDIVAEISPDFKGGN